MNDKILDIGFRRQILFIILFLFASLYVVRLFQMQILDRPEYEEKSEENSVKAIEIDAPRGVIYDRNFDVLVSNRPSYSLSLVPETFDADRISFVESKLEMETGFINEIFEKYKNFPSHLPRKIKSSLDTKNIAWIAELGLPGMELRTELQRDYSFGVFGSHLFGYIREIDSKTLKERDKEYSLGDLVGSSGLEKQYEDILRGTKGFNYLMSDSKQRIIGKYEGGARDLLPEKGNDVVLTIDADVQKVAEEYFQNRTGALVAIEPATGEILAFVSAPYFDLTELSSINSNEVWNELARSKTKPLFNRATMSSNPPGSTFKMITAIAGLEEGAITVDDVVNCPGGYQFGDRFFKCTHVHGPVNVVSAIERSCNTFFYRLILKVGLDNWSKYGKIFGFGEKTGIDITPEINGIMPDTDYFDKTYGKGKWTKGYLVSLGIGQGNLISSPVQLAKYTMMLAVGNEAVVPHFLKGYINKKNEFIQREYKKLEVPINSSTMELIREGMFRVVNGNGTARNIYDERLQICGKTGTAQNPHGEDHALFIAFAPKDNPKIAVSVIVENVGYGSTHAAPAAKKVIETYLTKIGVANSPQVLKAGIN